MLAPLRYLTLALLVLLPPSEAGAAESEAVEMLLAYLRIDTSNPPGREATAAAYLSKILHREGIPTQTFFSPGGRANLVARLSASERTEPALVLLHHLDVVPPGEGWTQPAFEGIVRDGKVWGRGAIDSKSLGVAHLLAFLELRRSRVALKRDVLFLATADEERGGREGVGWLLGAHAQDLGELGVVLTEGGANRVIGDRHLWWGIEVAQKRPLWLELKTTGRPGHGSEYNPASATHRLLRGLGRALEIGNGSRLTAAAHVYFRAIAVTYGPAFRDIFDHSGLAQAQQALREAEEDRRLYQVKIPSHALIQDTLQVTSLSNPSQTQNVVPGQARATLDIRLLPDTDTERYLERLRQALGDGVEVTVLLDAPPLPDPDLGASGFQTLRDELGKPLTVPAFITGTTDARYFRQHGIEAYGFSPFRLSSSESRGVHGPDESIPLEEFLSGVRLMSRVASAFARRDTDRGQEP